jgi:hypothetical protein
VVPIATSDFPSNAPEQIKYVATVIGKSAHKLAVFDAVYHHKAKARSIKEIRARTGLSRIQVLNVGVKLAAKQVVRQTERNGDIAYARRPEIHGHKNDILSLVKNKNKLKKWATKREPVVTVNVRGGGGKGRRPTVKRLTVDDVDSFRKVAKVEAEGYLPRSVSEEAFKRGVQKIVGEPGKWKDWGGELHDLATTRLIFKGKRRTAVFAFKGPGQRGPLVPGKMGKNGDQIQRMFLADAQVFFVQFWERIQPSVLQLLRSLAVDKAVATDETIWYGIIDGKDSLRLYKAYPNEFKGRRTPQVRKRNRTNEKKRRKPVRRR